MSEETKKKIGIANSKYRPSTETRNRLSNVLKEKYKKDADFVKRMKEAHKDDGPKISKAKKGVKQSEERKKLQSKVISKLWENEEYRKHMSDVHKGRKQPLSQIEKRRKTQQENRRLREELGLPKNIISRMARILYLQIFAQKVGGEARQMEIENRMGIKTYIFM